MPTRRRNIVVRPDGRPVNVARSARPALRLRHRLLLRAHRGRLRARCPPRSTTTSGSAGGSATSCTSPSAAASGPCALANVVLLLLDGQALWFHVDRLRPARSSRSTITSRPCWRPTPPAAAARSGAATSSRPRPGSRGRTASRSTTRRPWRRGRRHAGADLSALPGRRRGTRHCRPGCAASRAAREPRGRGRAAPERRARLRRALARARLRHGGGAVRARASSAWEEFRQALIAPVAAAEARGGEFQYYEAWLAAFERVLARARPGRAERARGDDLPVRVRRARRRLLRLRPSGRAVGRPRRDHLVTSPSSGAPGRRASRSRGLSA